MGTGGYRVGRKPKKSGKTVHIKQTHATPIVFPKRPEFVTATADIVT